MRYQRLHQRSIEILLLAILLGWMLATAVRQGGVPLLADLFPSAARVSAPPTVQDVKIPVILPAAAPAAPATEPTARAVASAPQPPRVLPPRIRKQRMLNLRSDLIAQPRPQPVAVAPTVAPTADVGAMQASPVPAPSIPAASGDSIVGAPTISPAQIDAVLATYGSPAAGLGQTIYDLGVAYGIDPAYCLAFFIKESQAGTAGIATITRSMGNIRSTGGEASYKGFRAYGDWADSIEDWYRLMRVTYVDRWGLTTVAEIIPVYAPASDGNNPQQYINQVQRLVDGWRSLAQ